MGRSTLWGLRAGAEHGIVLAQATALIPYRSSAVARVLVDRRHPWSVSLDGNGGELLARVGVSIGKVAVYKHVRLEMGAASASTAHDRIMLPVNWSAVGGPPLFPRMEGTFHVDPYGVESTRLTLNARYDPPVGALGALLDRALMHRLAQATMDDFMVRLTAAVTEELRSRADA